MAQLVETSGPKVGGSIPYGLMGFFINLNLPAPNRNENHGYPSGVKVAGA